MNKEELQKSLREAGAIDVFGREVRMSRAPVVVTREVPGEDTPDDARLQGYAAMFNRETVIGGWWKFREQIAPGAFTKTVKEADVRHLFNHDPSQVLGRNKAGTLVLTEDKTGLHYDVDLNMKDPDAIRVFEKVQRGDVDQSSFAFVVLKEQWEEPDDPDSGELPLRTILEAKLYDTSTVTYPAYEDTTALISSSADKRALEELGLDAPDFRSQIANNKFSPDLAPALREAARRAEELAVRCEEGTPCEQAAEEAPAAGEERAEEDSPASSVNTYTFTIKDDRVINVVFTDREEEHPDEEDLDDEVVTEPEAVEEETKSDDLARHIIAHQEQMNKLARLGISLPRGNK